MESFSRSQGDSKLGDTSFWTIRWLWCPFQDNLVQGTPNNLLLLRASPVTPG